VAAANADIVCRTGFNGAATEESRKPYLLRGQVHRELGFNGAATEESRKPPPDADVALTTRGFNGAATEESRKRQLPAPNRSRSRASMGPRLKSRGN